MQGLHGRSQLVDQPRRKHESSEQRENHRHRTQLGDRRHIRPHHAAHRSHRQQGRHHRERGNDGRVAHLAHGIYCSGYVGFAGLQPAPVDILHHHHCIVHQNADGKYHRKQAHPVDGHTQHPCAKYGKQNDDGNNDCRNNGGAQTQGEESQQYHRAGCNKQLEDQFVDLVLRRFSVVARISDIDVVGNQPAFQPLDFLAYLARYINPVCALLFGHGNRYRRLAIGHRPFFMGLAGKMLNNATGFFRTVGYIRDVTQIDGRTVMYTDHQCSHILGALQKTSRVDFEVAPAQFEFPGCSLGIGRLDRARHMIQRHSVRGQFGGRYIDAYLFLAATDNKPGAGFINFLHPLQNVSGKLVQGGVIKILRPQGHRHHRHVIHALGLDQRLHDAGGHDIQIGSQLGI